MRPDITKGRLDDIPSDLKAFLDYVDGILGNDEFVQEIDREIEELKKQESERVAYMTYAMKIQEERDEERKNNTIEHIKSLMQTTGWTIEKALEALKIPEMEWEQYKIAIQG